MNDLLTINNYSFTYLSYNPQNGQGIPCASPAVSELSMSLAEGSWTILCGHTGSGKSTLLRALKPEICPAGLTSGEILFRGKPLSQWSDLERCSKLGYLSQHPQDQCVTDRVSSELSFGLENLGLSPSIIQQKVAEIVTFFHLEPLYHKTTAELSGGQLQLVNLAAIMAMEPDILLLDEPTAQLDPPSELEFLMTLSRLHTETGLTIFMAEHKLSFPLPADVSLAVMEHGKLLCHGSPQEVIPLLDTASPIYKALPLPYRLTGTYPMDFHTCRSFIADHVKTLSNESRGPEPGVTEPGVTKPSDTKPGATEAALQVKDLWFRYHRKAPDVLRGLNAVYRSGHIYAIMGSNGSGKSTFLQLLSGALPPQAGKIHRQSPVSLLPQDPETMLLTDCLEKEVVLQGKKLQDLPAALSCYPPSTHPYDLSGGEKQLLALWKILQTGRTILLLDEPQKGLDAGQKKLLCAELTRLKTSGYTLLLVTHDTDFAADIADYCQILSGGELTQAQPASLFFTTNRLYTSTAARLTRNIFAGIYREQELIECCKPTT